MKQFTWLSNLTGYTHGPHDLHRASKTFAPDKDAEQQLDRLAVGNTWRDEDGDVWTRLPDILDPTIEEVTPDGLHIVLKPVDEALEARSQQAERLERIATAAFSAIINKRPFFSGTDGECLEILESDARGAVIAAKALIAELDKQS